MKMMMEKFKEWLIVKGYSSTSIATMAKAVAYFMVWAEKENITDITATTHNDVVAYIQHYNIKGTGKKTIAHYVMHLKKYFDWLMSEGEVGDNPCSNIKIKGIRRKVLHEILSIEELEKLYHDYITEINIPGIPMQLQTLARKRNKIIVGLLVYQGLQTEEIIRLQTTDIQLREGKIKIAGAKRSNGRTLKLASGQVFDLLDYINDTRKQILHYKKTAEPVQELFLNLGDSERKNNLFAMLLTHLKAMNGKLKSLNQLRASVIVHWLKLYNLRRVQVMAGHRYIGSTEAYKANDLDDLKEDIKNYHPL
jgi:site-specific recombinase XerD